MKITAEELINQINYYTDDISKLDIDKVSLKDLINILSEVKENYKSEYMYNEAAKEDERYAKWMKDRPYIHNIGLRKILAKYRDIACSGCDWTGPERFYISLKGPFNHRIINYYGPKGMLLCDATKKNSPLASGSDFTKLKKLILELLDYCAASFYPGRLDEYKCETGDVCIIKRSDWERNNRRR